MSWEPIEAGDLVRVVRVHCAQSESMLGHIFLVVGLGTWAFAHCRSCGAVFPSPGLPFALTGPQTGMPCSWVRKIKPLDPIERSETLLEVLADREREREVSQPLDKPEEVKT